MLGGVGNSIVMIDGGEGGGQQKRWHVCVALILTPGNYCTALAHSEAMSSVLIFDFSSDGDIIFVLSYYSL